MTQLPGSQRFFGASDIVVAVWGCFDTMNARLPDSSYIVAEYSSIEAPSTTPPRLWEKLELKGKAIFDIPFMIQSHAENMKKIMEAL